MQEPLRTGADMSCSNEHSACNWYERTVPRWEHLAIL